MKWMSLPSRATRYLQAAFAALVYLANASFAHASMMHMVR
jgi:hypothetical protein